MLLSESKDKKKLMCYLEKCFSGICRLGFDSLLNINAIYNIEEEVVMLVSKVSTSVAGDSVEKWFVQVISYFLQLLVIIFSRFNFDYCTCMPCNKLDLR